MSRDGQSGPCITLRHPAAKTIKIDSTGEARIKNRKLTLEETRYLFRALGNVFNKHPDLSDDQSTAEWEAVGFGESDDAVGVQYRNSWSRHE